MDTKITRNLVAFSDYNHYNYIPDDVLYINTDIQELCYNSDNEIYIIDTEIDNDIYDNF